MSTHIAWQGDHSELPTHAAAMFALPGVGNVGKLVIDSMLETLPSTQLLQFHHPDMPPHATMRDGLLQPPHIHLNSVELVDSRRILLIGGDAQPLIPRGQYEMAEAILQLLQQAGTAKLFILAGLACEAGSEAVHIVAADSATRIWLEGEGIPVSVDQPAGGVIGLCGLLASLGPSRGVSCCTVIAETFGTSVDTAAAERLRMSLQSNFGFDIPLSLDRTEDLAEELRRHYPEGPGAMLSAELLAADDSFYQ